MALLLRDLSSGLRFTICHLDMLRTIRITLERLCPAKVEVFLTGFTEWPLAGPKRRGAMIEKTFYVQNFLLRVGHVCTRFKKILQRNKLCCSATVNNLIKVTICLQFDSQRSKCSETDSQNQQFYYSTTKTSKFLYQF